MRRQTMMGVVGETCFPDVVSTDSMKIFFWNNGLGCTVVIVRGVSVKVQLSLSPYLPLITLHRSRVATMTTGSQSFSLLERESWESRRGWPPSPPARSSILCERVLNSKRNSSFVRAYVKWNSWGLFSPFAVTPSESGSRFILWPINAQTKRPRLQGGCGCLLPLFHESTTLLKSLNGSTVQPLVGQSRSNQRDASTKQLATRKEK